MDDRLFTATAADEADSSRPSALKGDRRRARAGHQPHIAAFHRRAQNALSRADAKTAVDGALKIADAFLVAVIIVRVSRQPGVHRGGDERLRDRMVPIHVGYGDRAIAAMNSRIARPHPAFAAREIWQHILIAPAAIAELRPIVEIRRLAPDID